MREDNRPKTYEKHIQQSENEEHTISTNAKVSKYTHRTKTQRAHNTTPTNNTITQHAHEGHGPCGNANAHIITDRNHHDADGTKTEQ